jgi:HPt (histidine-containing phosphotransfer) domain-containing protein
MKGSNMEAMIPDLPGFDTESALRLLAGNRKLYMNVLKRFHGQYAGSYESLAGTLLSDDWTAIQREAHTIKGLAGTIGHPALQEKAMELEFSIKDKPSVDAEEVRTRAKAMLGVFSDVLCQLGAAFAE